MNTNHSIPPHLSGDQATGLTPFEPIAQFEIGSMQNFIYLILDWSTKKAAMVDPQKDLEKPLGALKAHGFELESILLTHTHFDHTAGVRPLLELYPNLVTRVGQKDLHRLSKSILDSPGLKILEDGEEFSIGSFLIRAINTPGHSAGALSFYLETTREPKMPYLFTGDTIFIRDCGRTDLETGSNEELFFSIQKVKRLKPETVLLVGHHYAKSCATTLQLEKEFSPPFLCKTIEELANLP